MSQRKKRPSTQHFSWNHSCATSNCVFRFSITSVYAFMHLLFGHLFVFGSTGRSGVWHSSVYVTSQRWRYHGRLFWPTATLMPRFVDWAAESQSDLVRVYYQGTALSACSRAQLYSPLANQRGRRNAKMRRPGVRFCNHDLSAELFRTFAALRATILSSCPLQTSQWPTHLSGNRAWEVALIIVTRRFARWCKWCLGGGSFWVLLKYNDRLIW